MLDRLIADGEGLHEELGREYYVTGAGLKSDPEFQEIYDRYPFILSDEALALAQPSGSAPLLEWIVDTRVGRAVAPLEERQLVWEQQAEVEVGDKRLLYLRAPIELANSPDRDYRRALDIARAKVGSAGLNDIRRERFELEHSMVEALGMGQYVDARSRLSGIDLDELGLSCTMFLDRTADMYEECLEQLARRRLGLELGRLQRADAGWLFRADRFDSAFPSERLVETAARQMGEMGLDHTVGGRVRFDTDEREGKQPRAFCVPVQVPEEVYLVLRPRGGHSDYRTFWHELGHAMHFASVEPGLPFEARWLGDASVTEGFAMLWDHLTVNRLWLMRYTDLTDKDASELVFELAVAELFMARRYAAKLNYELELHRSDFTLMASRYAGLLGAATLFRYPKDDFLLDVDPAFYAARYLRAWQFEAAVATTLIEACDEDWYRNPKAGAMVQDLMRRGQQDPADKLAVEVTREPLTFAYVTERLEKQLAS
jgi:hypothetical protein